MLVKITNACSMGCSHCMEDSVPKAPHMTRATFQKALRLTWDLESVARERLGLSTCVLLSGGECSEHPEFEDFIAQVEDALMVPVLITNGTWLADEALRKRVLAPGRPIFVQVTNDRRFYPREVQLSFSDPRVGQVVRELDHLLPLGRQGHRKPIIPVSKAPSSFNLRSFTRSVKDIRLAIYLQRARGSQCAPSISHDGAVVAGESRNCFEIGTVNSSAADLTAALCEMRCNRCTLVDNLTPQQKAAIGET